MNMIRSFALTVALLSTLSLAGASRLSADVGNTVATTAATTTVRAIPVAPAAVSSPTLMLAAQQIFLFGGDPKTEANGQRGARNTSKFTEGPENINGVDPDDGDPSPNPEPSTLLSFGTALLIGAGVIYSRRRFGAKEKK
jgi:hypothetical protein